MKYSCPFVSISSGNIPKTLDPSKTLRGSPQGQPSPQPLEAVRAQPHKCPEIAQNPLIPVLFFGIFFDAHCFVSLFRKRCTDDMLSRLPLLCILTLLLAAGLTAQTYNIYYGDFHSHTWYSDGNQDQNIATYTTPVARAITFARSSPSMNWLGVSDHNHNEGGLRMSLANWAAGKHEADSVNQDGTFVGMYGQEWGVISGGGHVLVFGTDKLIGWDAGEYQVFVAKSDYTHLFDTVYKYGGFCYLAHPQQTDYSGIFSNPYVAKWDSVVRGCSIRSGPATSTNVTETDPSTTDYTARFHDLLRLGYHAAPVANQDNHNTTYGRANQQRTAVLATSLSRANVLDALNKRRVYATMDHNLQVRFTSGTHQMGEIFSSTSPVPLRVTAHDPDGGESITKIEIFSGVPGSGSAPTVLTSVTGAESLVVNQTQTNGTTVYYYARVTEADGQMAWTAPVWVTSSSTPPPGAFSLTSPSNGAVGQSSSGTLTWGSSANATGYDVYLSTTNPPATLVSSNQAGTTYPYSGLASGTTYYWKVTARNGGGTLDGTGSPFNFTTVAVAPGAFTLLAPSNGATTVPLSGTLRWNTSSNAVNYDVYLDQNNPPTTVVSSNQTDTSFAYGGLSNNTQYFWKVVAKNGVLTTTSTGAPWNFTTVMNAPGSFTQTAPANTSAHQPLSGNLSWQASSNATGYNVYFGATNPPPIVSFNQAGTTWPYGPLTLNTLYYWKITARNAQDSTVATGAPWSFTTIDPPGAFTLLTPSNGATAQPLNGSLTWDTAGHGATYDVYLDTQNPPLVKVDSNVSGTVYAYDPLLQNTVQYWTVVAKNIDGQDTATNGPFSFTTINVPPIPAGLTVSAATESTISLQWTDTASNETGYRVYRAPLADDPYVQVSPDLPANTQTFTDTGRSPNTRYFYHVLAFNGDGEGAPASVNGATLALVPGTPSTALAGGLNVRVTVDPGLNPGQTQFAIRAVVSAETSYVQSNGALLPAPAWRTFTEWGGGTGFIAHPTEVCSLYTFSVKARNGDNVETIFGGAAGEQLPCFAATVQMLAGWNLLSLPIDAPTTDRPTLYPRSASSAFLYDKGYVRTDSIVRGEGFWLKYGSPDSASFTGTPSSTDSIDILTGWNIIGALSYPVTVASIIQDPGSILTSPYFGYNGTYTIDDTLEPGRGYWVKANQAGRLILSSSSIVPKTAMQHQAGTAAADENALTTITLADRAGHERTLTIDESPSPAPGLFELPPSAPEGSFDARFEGNLYRIPLAGQMKSSIALQSPSWPVTLTWKTAANSAGYDLHTGLLRKRLTGSGSMTIERETGALSLSAVTPETRPAGFALYQNYPNPFNPSTEIRYDLPARSHVELEVFNPLGVRVAVLVDESQPAGRYHLTWNPAAASGVYFYRLRATTADSHTFSRVFRAVYLK